MRKDVFATSLVLAESLGQVTLPEDWSGIDQIATSRPRQDAGPGFVLLHGKDGWFHIDKACGAKGRCIHILELDARNDMGR